MGVGINGRISRHVSAIKIPALLRGSWKYNRRAPPPVNRQQPCACAGVGKCRSARCVGSIKCPSALGGGSNSTDWLFSMRDDQEPCAFEEVGEYEAPIGSKAAKIKNPGPRAGIGTPYPFPHLRTRVRSPARCVGVGTMLQRTRLHAQISSPALAQGFERHHHPANQIGRSRPCQAGRGSASIQETMASWHISRPKASVSMLLTRVLRTIDVLSPWGSIS